VTHDGKGAAVKEVKTVIIGAGSTVFTPGLIADLINAPHLNDSTVALVDIDPTAAEIMTRLAQRMARERGVALKIVGTTNRREVLPGATFVTTTIAAGGVKAWAKDVRIPERYGVHQTVGDSVGPSGVFRALRHVPELVTIAHDMEELCPDAWLFNYTNPLSVNVRGIQKSSFVKCIGLCHGILHTRQLVARELGLPAQELSVVAAGINHLSWLLDIRHKGLNMYPQLREVLLSQLETSSEIYNGDVYEGFQQVSARLMQVYGLYPSPGDRHVSEFFPYFLRKDEDILGYGLQGGLDMTNDILAGKGTLWDRLEAEANGTAPIDQSLFEETREGERVVSIMESILLDRYSVELAVNVRNAGLISNLPEEAVVEVPGVISGYGVRGVGVGPLPDGIANVLRSRIYQQELTVDAALSGNKQLALQALLDDPLIRNIDEAEAMLDEALSSHAEFLPQFGSPRSSNTLRTFHPPSPEHVTPSSLDPK
jgi:alpha-galactosidase